LNIDQIVYRSGPQAGTIATCAARGRGVFDAAAIIQWNPGPG